MEDTEETALWCPSCGGETRHLIDEHDNYECAECGELNDPRPKPWEI